MSVEVRDASIVSVPQFLAFGHYASFSKFAMNIYALF